MATVSNGTEDEYPLRPYAKDCSFHIRTGCCKFGIYCKFNHPVRGGFQGVKETGRGGFVEQQGQIPGKVKESKSESLVEKTGKNECKYHLSAGGCKYGNNCRYSHSKETPQKYIKKSEKAPLELNILGITILILLLLEDLTISMQPLLNLLLAGHSSGNSDPLQFKEASEPALDSWSSYTGSIFPSARTKLPLSSAAVNNTTKTADTSIYLQLVEEFPERAGEPQCDYFMKTGKYKTRSACKFHRPKS